MRLAGGAETAEVAFLGEPTANFNGPAIDRPRSSSLHSRLAGRSSAWLERLLWEQEVARSNRVAPTFKLLYNKGLRTRFQVRKPLFFDLRFSHSQAT